MPKFGAKLPEKLEDLAPQDYRRAIADVIRQSDPEAIILDPMEVVKERAASLGKSLETLENVQETFTEVVELVKDCDVIVSNLPVASMGSAVELWEAHKAKLRIFTISPMKDNWTIRSVTHHNFTDLADFKENFQKHL